MCSISPGSHRPSEQQSVDVKPSAHQSRSKQEQTNYSNQVPSGDCPYQAPEYGLMRSAG